MPVNTTYQYEITQEKSRVYIELMEESNLTIQEMFEISIHLHILSAATI